MYASVRRASGKPGSMGEIAKIIEDGYTDRLAQIPGFQGYYVVDAGNDQVITISLFDDESGASQSASLAQELVGSRLQQHMTSGLDVSNGRVIVQKRP